MTLHPSMVGSFDALLAQKQDITNQLMLQLQPLTNMKRITMYELRGALQNHVISSVTVLGKRRNKNDTNFYLIAVIGEEPRIYEAEKNVGPRAWRKFETIINFLQSNFFDELPLEHINLILESTQAD